MSTVSPQSVSDGPTVENNVAGLSAGPNIDLLQGVDLMSVPRCVQPLGRCPLSCHQQDLPLKE